jgi:hypothetical protein
MRKAVICLKDLMTSKRPHKLSAPSQEELSLNEACTNQSILKSYTLHMHNETLHFLNQVA